MTTSHLPQKIPMVSVVMAVKNGGDLISQAVNSIIHQTFQNFEIIIIDDGSDDNSLLNIRRLNDSRIKIYPQKNRGVARAANRGLALAQGMYIARIDHDDVWFPERLERQVQYLLANPEIALVGSGAVIWSGVENTGRFLDHPTKSSDLKWLLLFDNPFVHSSILFRRDVIREVGLYNPISDISPLDDYDFISRVAAKYAVANLSERLVAYREVPRSLTSEFRQPSKNSEFLLRKKLAMISSKNIARLNEIACDDTCIAFGMTVHDIPFQARRVRWRQIHNLLAQSQDRIGLISPDILSYRLSDIKVKWHAKEGHSSILHKLVVHLPMNAIFLNLNLQQVHHKLHLFPQVLSHYYWRIREAIYFKFGMKKVVIFSKNVYRYAKKKISKQ